MRWGVFVSIATLAGASAHTVRGLHDRTRTQARSPAGVPFDKWARDEEPVETKRFHNDKTNKYLLNGKGIPDVDFDIGEAYAGQMSISEDVNGPDKFYFWFQPSTNPAAAKEIVIWLNGGPGCSSLEGLLQEIGPFVWQYGTYKPVANAWAWHRLTNVLLVEQPINTGFSTGTVTAKNEDDVARQFMGFFRNFIDTFSMQGYKVYLTGESYAGMYCSYIASAMLDAKNPKYFDVKGMMIYDPDLIENRVGDMMAVPFVEYHRSLFPLNDSLVQYIHDTDRKCGFAALRDHYLSYPARGHLHSPLPGLDASTGLPMPGCGLYDMTGVIGNAIARINPCFNPYHIATTCPLLWDVLGYPGDFAYLPKGASIYFDRQDVKKAINAPLDRTWVSCGGPVFVDDHDTSAPPSTTVLGGVIDRTKNVVIGHGALDFVLQAGTTLLAIQNTTFGGKLGFQRRPTEPFYVPYHRRGDLGTIAGAGVLGTAHTERGLTYVGVSLSGHMVPQFAPSAAFRHLEYLLGRVESLSSREPFTTDPHVPQPEGPMGKGTAPPADQ